VHRRCYDVAVLCRLEPRNIADILFVVDVRTMANGYFYDAMLSRCRELADDVTGPIDHALESNMLRFSAFPRACLKFNSIPCAHTRDI